MAGPGGGRGGAARAGDERGLDRRLLGRLVVYLKPHWRGALFALAMIVGAAALETAVPLVTRHAVDVDLPARDLGGLGRSIAWFLGLSLGAFVLRYGQQLVTGWIGQSIVLRLRQKLFRRVLGLHPGWFDRHPVGQVMSRLTNDVESLNELFTGGMILIFQDILLLAAIAGVLLWMDWHLALVLFTVVPLIFLATFQFKRLTRSAFRRVRALVGEVTGFLQETISGMAVVQLFRREAQTRQRFAAVNDELMRENTRTIFYFAVFFPLMELLGSVATAAILWAAAGRLLENTLSFGDLVAFLAYADRFFRPIRDLAEKYNILQSAMAASERVFELLDEKPQLVAGPVGAPDGPPAPERRGEVVLEKVWFAYEGENWVLRDVSLRIPAGTSAALVGYTGAGKSSVAGLLLRFYEFQKGRILVDGVDIRQWDPAALRARMAIVLQDVFLFSGTVEENIRLGRDLPEGAVERALGQTGLEGLGAGPASPVGERGQLLSGGQRQLVSFARALAGDPALLILDEATSSVDSVSEEAVQRAIGELMRGRGSLVIAHRLSTIREAGRIFVLHQGRLVEEGSHDELLALDGTYARLWRLEQPVATGSGHAA